MFALPEIAPSQIEKASYQNAFYRFAQPCTSQPLRNLIILNTEVMDKTHKDIGNELTQCLGLVIRLNNSLSSEQKEKKARQIHEIIFNPKVPFPLYKINLN